jgi:predicted nucleotide-binding protein
MMRGETPSKTLILMLASNPSDAANLEVAREFDLVTEELWSGIHRDQFEVVLKLDVTIDRLTQLVLRYRPTVIHFSGHGTSDSELVFRHSDGSSVSVDSELIAELFSLASETTRIVVLNACHTAAQAQLIARHVDVVVGMQNAVSVDYAVQFSAGFYCALSNGKSVASAFKAAEVHARLLAPRGAEIPRLLVREGLDPEQIQPHRRRLADGPGPVILDNRRLPPRERDLFELLGSLFAGPTELREFLERIHPAIMVEVASEEVAGFEEIALTTIAALIRHELVTASLAEQLIARAPGRADSIRKVVGQFSVAPTLPAHAGHKIASFRPKSHVFLVSATRARSYRYTAEFLGRMQLGILDPTKLASAGAVHVLDGLKEQVRVADAIVVLASDDDAPLAVDTIASARANLIFIAGLAFASRPKSTILVKHGRPAFIDEVGALRGIISVALDHTSESEMGFASALRRAGCKIARAVDLGPAESPAPVDEQPMPTRIAILRRLRTMLPFPSMGEGLEITGRVELGDDVFVSIRSDMEGLSDVTLHHWRPGESTADVIPLEGPNMIAVRVDGPPGLHVLELIQHSPTAIVGHRIGRTTFVVAGK